MVSITTKPYHVSLWGAVVGVLILALASASLVLGGLAQAQDEGPITYPEDDPGPVAVYTAVDPEEESIVWSLEGADAEDFAIDDGVLTFKSQPDFESPGSAATSNEYSVTVVASDSEETNALKGEMEVTVTVTNVDEAGTLTLSTLQPVDGIEVTTTLTDIDSVTSGNTVGTVTAEDIAWKWANSSSKTGAYEDIEDAEEANYTPQPADVDHYLRVTATYTDPQGADKTAMATTAHKVLVPRSTNTAPVFKDSDDMEIADGTAITREVAENTPEGEPVGAPVAASDAEGDVLTYTLSGGDDVASFSIDVATGQLRTKAALDTEDDNDANVMVTATDPFTGTNSDAIRVDITVANVDEAPKLSGPASPKQDENTPIATAVGTYTATDDEDDADANTDVVLTLSGADAAAFDLTDADSDDEYELNFKGSPPNFEDPKDAGKNNVYNVTVTATDSDDQTDTIDVTVTVENVDEAGTVTLSTVQPRIGTALTATLTDIDGTPSDVKWMWERGDGMSVGSPQPIEGADSDTYTPVMDDDGKYLRATATSYTDPQGSGQPAVSAASANAVEIDDTNRAPTFPDQDMEAEGDQTDQEREIAENTETALAIGDTDTGPVVATDPNEGDVLTYTLGGADGASFSIVRDSGHLQTKAPLNREDKDTYMVTVTATDPSGLSATVNVTIKITNVPEAPTLEGMASVRHAENTPATTAVATYTAMDDEDDKAGTAIRWTLTGADDDDFTITGGLLSFKSSPNFEDDADNVSNVTVTATDSDDQTDTIDVTVTVTNVDEAGTVTLSTLQPVDGIALTATLTDIDGTVTGMTWKWAKSTSPTGAYTDIDGEAAAAYTPDPDDENRYLRATVTYTDPQGSDKTAMAVSARKVVVSRSTNTAPVFKDADDMEIEDGTAITREVAENTPKGEPVGAPVAASDAEGDVLTYTLGEDDVASFSIDVATGQLRTKAALDREATDGAEYTVMVTATDPFTGDAANSDMITVTITVTNVDEAPKLTGMASPRQAETEITEAVATYTAMDDEDDVANTAVVLSLSGADESAFDFTGGVLTFKASPNFEDPKDTGKDNVYNITVVATDSDEQTDEMDVTVTVTNVDEAGDGDAVDVAATDWDSGDSHPHRH